MYRLLIVMMLIIMTNCNNSEERPKNICKKNDLKVESLANKYMGFDNKPVRNLLEYIEKQYGIYFYFQYHTRYDDDLENFWIIGCNYFYKIPQDSIFQISLYIKRDSLISLPRSFPYRVEKYWDEFEDSINNELFKDEIIDTICYRTMEVKEYKRRLEASKGIFHMPDSLE